MTLIILKSCLCHISPATGFSGMMVFAWPQSSGVTWSRGVARHSRARGCEKQIVNPGKGQKCNKRQSAKSPHLLSRPHAAPSLCHTFNTRKSAKFISGRWVSGLQGITFPSVWLERKGIKNEVRYDSTPRDEKSFCPWEMRLWDGLAHNTRPKAIVHALLS